MHFILKHMSYKSVLLFMVAVSLAGCMGHVSVDGEWEEDASQNQTFANILVVGLSPNASARCDFESFMVTQIRAIGVEAKASCMLMKTSEPLTRESIEAAVNEYGADAVLTTMLMQADIEAEEGGDSETRGGIYFKATGTGYATPYYRGGYGRYGVPVVYGEFRMAPVITTVEGEVQIRSMLFATSDAELVYVMKTKASNLNSREDALASITPEIAASLQGAGLLRGAQ
jgi:hypothetical protein